jgi:glyoxylase-like metal-dependent hydrolase (beta-lactamase superfamily II)
MIVEKLVVGPLECNCYIVADEKTKEAIIIDPGDEAESILDRVRRLKLDIKLIFLSHGHVDHTAALSQVRKATGAEVAIHADDKVTLSDDYLSLFIGVKKPKNIPPNRLLEDGDGIMVGGLSFRILHTPGHTPGGTCLYGEGVLFSGDTLFNYGIGRPDLPGGDAENLLKSINNHLMILPDETKVYPGHGPETTIGAERRGNPFLV